MVTITIEVVLALPHKQILRRFSVPKGTTVSEAIELSLIKNDFEKEITLPLTVGIFGKKVSFSHQLEHEDRIEIYRPLLVDPKDNRRLRALKKKRKKHE